MCVPGSAPATQPELEAIQIEIYDRRREKRKKLAQDKAADYGDAERTTKFGTGAVAQRQRKRAKKRGHGGHENGTEAKQASLVDGFHRRKAFLRFGLDGEVNHEDGVFLDDADQKNNADEGDERKLGFEKHHGEQSTHACGRKCRKNRDGMNEAFIEDAKDDVDRGDRGDDQHENGRL